MITAETRAEICRLVKVEHLTITQTAKRLGVHHSTVERALNLHGKMPHIARLRGSKLDEYAALIEKKLEEHPDIKATSLGRILRDRGYRGCVESLRLRLKQLRGKKAKRAYLPIITYAGDEAQVDWAHFGTLRVGKTERKLSCFVMVLSYSRAVFARFFFDQSLDSFLAGHVQAFTAFKGVPRQLRYDNLRAAVAERYGSTIRYNEQLLELAGYYCFRPSACNPYSGHEKGRVERTIRYIRENFFVGRTFTDIASANAALAAWTSEVAAKRCWPEDRRRVVEEVFLEERSKLIPLPQAPFPTSLIRPARSGKIPFIRFDKNDYSIPFELCGKPLSLSANEQEIVISDGAQVVTRHGRSYSAGERIIIQDHFHKLVASKPGAETVTARRYFTELIPRAEDLFHLMVERGVGLGHATAKLFELIRTYGKPIVAEAIEQAITRGHGEPSYVALVCEQLSKKKSDFKSTLNIELPAHLPGAHITVKPHDLATYDDLHLGDLL